MWRLIRNTVTAICTEAAPVQESMWNFLKILLHCFPIPTILHHFTPILAKLSDLQFYHLPPNPLCFFIICNPINGFRIGTRKGDLSNNGDRLCRQVALFSIMNLGKIYNLLRISEPPTIILALKPQEEILSTPGPPTNPR